MSEKQIKQIKEMCRSFCLANNIKWSRGFERRYVKEFFQTRKMQIQSIVERRNLGIYKERRKSIRYKANSVLVPPPPATEGNTD